MLLVTAMTFILHRVLGYEVMLAQPSA